VSKRAKWKEGRELQSNTKKKSKKISKSKPEFRQSARMGDRNAVEAITETAEKAGLS